MKKYLTFIFLLLPSHAFSQIPQAQLDSWEFRAYACKNAALIAHPNFQMESRHGFDAVFRQGEQMSVEISGMLAQQDDGHYSFSSVEVSFIGSVGFSIWYGISSTSNSIPESPQIFNQGFRMCVSQIEDFSRQLD